MKTKKRASLDQEIQDLESKLSLISQEPLTTFDQLPLSHPTAQGLAQAHYVQMTAIQQQSLLLSLQQRDLLGAAKTGSGKTLAFLIPALEILYRAKWTALDKVGVLIISPTRELVISSFFLTFAGSPDLSSLAKDWEIPFFFCWASHWRQGSQTGTGTCRQNEHSRLYTREITPAHGSDTRFLLRSAANVGYIFSFSHVSPR